MRHSHSSTLSSLSGHLVSDKMEQSSHSDLSSSHNHSVSNGIDRNIIQGNPTNLDLVRFLTAPHNEDCAWTEEELDRLQSVARTTEEMSPNEAFKKVMEALFEADKNNKRNRDSLKRLVGDQSFLGTAEFPTVPHTIYISHELNAIKAEIKGIVGPAYSGPLQGADQLSTFSLLVGEFLRGRTQEAHLLNHFREHMAGAGWNKCAVRALMGALLCHYISTYPRRMLDEEKSWSKGKLTAIYEVIMATGLFFGLRNVGNVTKLLARWSRGGSTYG